MTGPSGVPDSPGELTVDWLDRTLSEAGVLGDRRITGFTVERPSSQGATSEVVFLRLRYDGPTAAPPVVVAKFQIADERVRGAMSRAYRREVDFYTGFGADPGIPVPACYFAHYDPARHGTLLLLEFVDHAAAMGADRITFERLRPIVRCLAGFHARWWGREAELADRQVCDELSAEFLEPRIAHVTEARRVISEQFADRAGAAETLALLDRWLGRAEVLARHVGTRTRTLCHNDFHPGQLCLADGGAGELRVFDWQEPAIALGTDDLATLLSHILIELPANSVEAYESEAVRLYHRHLCELGVDGYGVPALEHDYRLSVIKLLTRRAGFFGTVGMAVLEDYWRGVDPTTDMWSGMYERQSRAIARHRLVDLLDRLGG